ncbi:acetyltransferase [Lacticaseibacillus rhamnosus]|nr:acetyltransferase [Lacticaseibacillus rhamnosus]
MTRSPAQESACKDLRRNGQERAITPQAAYTPIPNRAGSRSPLFDHTCVNVFHMLK